MKFRKSSVLQAMGQLQHRSEERYLRVLLLANEENCQVYDWSKKLSGFIRSRRLDLLYAWADAVPTVVWADAKEHFAAHQMSALIRKYPWDWKAIGLASSPEDKAIASFLAAENKCRRTNKRFSKGRHLRSNFAFRLDYMRRWILHVLGETPPYGKIFDKCNFSSGSNVGIHGHVTNLSRKLHEDWTVSPGAHVDAFEALVRNDQYFHFLCERKDGVACLDMSRAYSSFEGRCVDIPYNMVTFVPKTAKTHRAIAVEPTLSSYLQSGVDQHLKGLLRSHGYDLSDQSRNAKLARVGSIDGSLATIDLAAASDTISLNVVKFLLPPDWFEFLDRIRSPNYSLDKGESQHRYEKFASMGNGFCFPLETLIFAAAVRCAIHESGSHNRTHSVYGDDIIVPTEACDQLMQILQFLGFTANLEKSFTTGPFRESCGADWYDGQDVRPVFLDSHLNSQQAVMVFHNTTLESQRASVFFEGVRDFLRLEVPEASRFCRPITGRAKRLTRDRTLQWYDTANANGAFSVPFDTFMSSIGAYFCRRSQIWRWREISFRPVEDQGRGRPDHEYARFIMLLRGSPGGRMVHRRKATVSIVRK